VFVELLCISLKMGSNKYLKGVDLPDWGSSKFLVRMDKRNP